MNNLFQLNPKAQLLVEYVSNTRENIFLTGKAGTGKTTLLHYIQSHCKKNMITLAPTGVAAINAKGVTIHSFFQLPFIPFVPNKNLDYNDNANNIHQLISTLRYNKNLILSIQKLDLIIIDEISMVRADVLDEIDIILKHFRNNFNEPFGGVQILCIGDMYQLPPVCKDTEWSMLSKYYSSIYFFDSEVLRESPLLQIELEYIYRQKDDVFLEILNEIRNGNLSEENSNILHQKYVPNFNNNTENFITLTTHNAKANQINTNKLNEINEKEYSYKAEITGDFPEHMYPCEKDLILKVNTQVMFLRNDTEKAYFNGKIGNIVALNNNEIIVQCEPNNTLINVKKEIWENIKYSNNNNKIEQEIIGTFTQYPLRLAWAITIHKSQGLTFENAIIDAGASFAKGQIYVALSRCKSMQGLVLQSKISPILLKVDERIIEFSQQNKHQNTLNNRLVFAKKIFAENLIIQMFSIEKLQHNFSSFFQENIKTYQENNQQQWFAAILSALNDLQNVFLKFQPKLVSYFYVDIDINENYEAQTKINKAATYFTTHLQILFEHTFKHPFHIKNKKQADEINTFLNNFLEDIYLKIEQLHLINQRFFIEQLQEKIIEIKLNFPKVNTYIEKPKENKSALNNIENKGLYNDLAYARQELAKAENCPLFHIVSNTILEEMCLKLPQHESELLNIKGFGKIKTKKYGDTFLKLIIDYCKNTGISLRNEIEIIENKSSKKLSKSESAIQSFELFKMHKTIADTALARNLKQETIINHLIPFIKLKEILIEELLSNAQMNRMQEVFITLDENAGLKTMKTALGDDFSYNDIKLFLASIQK
jgi:hypothetical protein